MKRVIKKRDGKYVTEKTFEKHMRSVAKSFADNAEVMVLILKEIKTIHEDNKYFKENISSLNSDGLFYGRKIDDLIVRTEKLESKSK